MKTLIKLFCLVFLVGGIVSCEDDDKKQFGLFEGNDAPFVNILLSKTLIGKTAPLAEEVVTGIVNAPGNNVDSWSLQVRVNGSVTTPWVDVITVTSFPTTISLATADLATLTGVNLADLEPADEFEFFGTATGNGVTIDGNDLAADLQGQPEQNQAFDFSFILFCSAVAENFVGDWTLDLVDTWGDGWDGAFMTSTIDGVDTNYTVGAASAQFTVNVPAGSQVIWTYTSGSFESEHNFTMTGPDGTVYGPWDGAVADIPFCFWEN